MAKLSNRLLMVAAQVPPGSRLADIGSDHTLLPIHLAESGRIPFAVAGELNDGPYETARNRVREAGLERIVHVRKGDGLTVVSPGEVDVVVIAGMGGALIASILENGKTKLDSVSRLVLQPNVAEDAVRRWLAANGWLLCDEALLYEDGQFYEVLTAVRSEEADERNRRLYAPKKMAGGPVVPTDMLFKMGPLLIDRADNVFREKWRLAAEKIGKIVAGMALSDSEAAETKRRALMEEKRLIEEVLRCLPTARRSSS
jgi:tRNA (adenine22-N1)-methyltransferase